MINGAHAAAIHKAFNNCVALNEQEITSIKEWFTNLYYYHRDMGDSILTVYYAQLKEQFEHIETERKH